MFTQLIVCSVCDDFNYVTRPTKPATEVVRELCPHCAAEVGEDSVFDSYPAYDPEKVSQEAMDMDIPFCLSLPL